AAVGVEIRRMAAVCAHEGRWPGMIGMLAAFHAHHVRAEVGEQARAERAGEHVGEIEHADAGERRGNFAVIVAGHVQRRFNSFCACSSKSRLATCDNGISFLTGPRSSSYWIRSRSA